MTEVVVPGLRLESEANSHAHWRARQRRAKAQHSLVRVALAGVEKPNRETAARCRVTFTRVMGKHGQKFDVGDNLNIAFKHVRDAVAKWAGVDDRDPWWDWVYDSVQERGPGYAVRIKLEAVTEGA